MGVLVTAGGVEYRKSQEERTMETSSKIAATIALRFIRAIMHLLNLEQSFDDGSTSLLTRQVMG
jgi:hypothetical protein